ncbi:MAG: selenocysteine-specific translation elongation factor, partial [Planctomycetota bacterium]|nr:selenocysteine-specific translation elongation factor [Planctomycetota bacterium]
MTTLTISKSIIVGTAGHIDHGKTRLVGKLSGIDTDRLPEEKARGISIDLGFAHMRAGDLQLGIVDVPGHERFVRNMVAGATGINVAMLVVAADDAVMPQTREHLDIMDLLGIRVGLVALTKIDLVDEDMVELARCDIEDNLTGTFLEGCPIVPVSSETGEGLDELKATLLEICSSIQLPQTLPLFRMAIDRVFSIPGHGTVVTGSVLSGDVHVGDSLDLWPEGREVRVRSVQRHGEQADEAGSRQRTAINLAGLKHDEVSRGCELATPGYLKPTKRLLVDLKLLDSAPIGLKNRIEVGLHTGTREIPCRVILKGRRLEPGERGYAELRLSEPMVATWGQRFILRRISPAITLGGGTILDPHIPDLHRIRDVETVAEQLANPSSEKRLAARLAQRDVVSSSDLTLASSIGVMPDELQKLLTKLRSDGKLVRLGKGDRVIEIHADRLESLAGS